MGACRESFDIWLALNKRPKILLSGFFWKRAFQSGYFWHDSFGKYWYRLIGFYHHHEPVILEDSCDSNDPGPKLYCFKCEKELPA